MFFFDLPVFPSPSGSLYEENYQKVRKKGKDLLKGSSNITKQRIEECSTFGVKRQQVKEWHHLLVTQTLNHKTPLLRLKVKILLPRRRIIKTSKDMKLFITFFKTCFICQINYACTQICFFSLHNYKEKTLEIFKKCAFIIFVFASSFKL